MTRRRVALLGTAVWAGAVAAAFRRERAIQRRAARLRGLAPPPPRPRPFPTERVL